MNGQSLGPVQAQQNPSARSLTPSSHLGKRKRSQSPEKPLTNGDTVHASHDIDGGSESTLDSILREIEQFDVSPQLLGHPIPQSTTNGPLSKRRKTEDNNGSIESRIANNYYSSTSLLLRDLRLVLQELNRAASQVNGLSNGTTHNLSSSDLSPFERLLSKYSQPQDSSLTKSHDLDPAYAGQIITLRSNDAGIAKQLFTGSRKPPINGVKVEDIDISKLPSGFDVVDAVLPESLQPTETNSRTFGDVFQPIRNLRPLEPPKTSRGTRDTHLNFAKPFEDYGVSNKEDYRLAPLSAGHWLEYAIPDRELGKVFQPIPVADSKDSTTLFKSTFSSFAPSQDTSAAVIPSSQRSRQWFSKYGDQAMQSISSVSGSAQWPVDGYPDIDDDYQHLIDEFIPAAEEEPQAIPSPEEDPEKSTLDEISDLLSTLCSYQRLRDLDRSRVFSATTKPAGPEVEVYDLLRQQLNLLVSTLPPFAVAKLDGDQLEALNISTNILVATPDVAGTGQPDEGTLQRARQLLAPQQPQTRPAQPRNSYTSATPAVNYGSQARAYSSTMPTTPSMPGYAQRGAQMYNTPRPSVTANNAAYGQNSYQQRPQQPFPGATIQQFQRIQNGYNQNNQTPYQPRATQPSYQPQMQASSGQQYDRSNSPAKPLTNGTPQPQQVQQYRNSYSTPSSTSILQGPYAQANAHATIQQVKAAHQMQQQQAHQSQSQSPQPQAIQALSQQRHSSGTPQPQIQPSVPPPSTKVNTLAEGTANGVTSQTQQHPATTTGVPTPVAGASA